METASGAKYLNRTVGELVAENYARAATLSDARIDFCCGGARTLAAACHEAGVSTDAVVDALAALDEADAGSTTPDLRTWSLDRVVEHIEEVHHAYLRRTLPVLGGWTDKIARVHGRAHPELLEVRTLLGELAGELTGHMKHEEEVVFPLLVALDAAAAQDAVSPPPAPESLVDALENEHEQAGSLTRRIRELTDGFSPPPDACNTYRAALALLEEFEADLHRHVHLENNVLFPRARVAYAVATDDSRPTETKA